jgi:hypothetical protein
VTFLQSHGLALVGSSSLVGLMIVRFFFRLAVKLAVFAAAAAALFFVAR